MADAPYALVSLIDNDQRLYRMRQHADKQLALKKARGVYDRERARSAYTGLVELLARDAEKALADYEERQPHPWHVAWSKAERTATEKELVARFENAWANPKSAEHTELLKALPKKFQGGAFAEQLSDDDVKARRKGAFTLAQLEALPAISEGHTSDLKWDTGRTRVWLSRMTKEDGMPYDNQVTVEVRQPAGKSPEWKTALKYQAKGRPLSQFLLPRLEAEAAYFRAQRMFPGKHVALGKSEHPGQAMLQSTQLTRNQLLKTLKVQHDSAASLRRAMAKVKKHESGGNPKVGGASAHSASPLSGPRKDARDRAISEAADGARRSHHDRAVWMDTAGNFHVSLSPEAPWEAVLAVAHAPRGHVSYQRVEKPARAPASAARHESGNNPRTKKHPLDAAAVQRIERAAARKHIPSSVKPITKALYATRRATRKRWPQGASAADVGLKARVDALVGRSKK